MTHTVALDRSFAPAARTTARCTVLLVLPVVLLVVLIIGLRESG